MADWKQAYYDRKHKEHMELVQCWCYATLVGIALAVATGLVVGALCLADWLIGGA